MQAGSCEAPPGPHLWAVRVSIISAHLGTCWFLCACGGWTPPRKCPRALHAFKDSPWTCEAPRLPFKSSVPASSGAPLLPPPALCVSGGAASLLLSALAAQNLHV